MARPRYPVSDHCDGTKFFNPHAISGRDLGDVIKWQRERHSVAWPEQVALIPQPPPPTSLAPGRVAATFIGHSTFFLRTAAATLITDPVFTTHAGPFGRSGPRRVRPPAITIDRLPAVSVALVSHNHYDHLQPSSLRALRDKSDPVFVAPLGLEPFLRGIGLSKVTELDWWESYDAGPARITAVPAQHFSARTPFDRNRTLWCGFIVGSGDATIYFAGDTGYSPQFAEIGRRFSAIDLALIPIGAYEPRWFMQPMHVNPAEAVRIYRDVEPRVALGMHFGTFRLTDEGIDDPLRALDAARAEAGLRDDAFRVLEFGESAIV